MKKKWQPELPGGYLPLYHRILESDVFNSLSAYSQIIYIRALDKANKSQKRYDGVFTLTPSDFKKGGIKEKTFRRHIKPLFDKGLIELLEKGGMYRNANKYRLKPIRNIFLNNIYKHWGMDTI